MTDYKEMYIKLFQASEKAANILISAQQECEKLYISQIELRIVPLSSENKKGEHDD